jgi:hypothetical protein
MADNYLQFSQRIEKLGASERQWVLRALDAHGPHWPPDFEALGLASERIDAEAWPDFRWEVKEPEGDLWLYAEESADLTHVGEFARAFLARFRPAGCFGLTWSETCSRLREGEFGGGGMFVTAHAAHTWSAHEWLARQRQRLRDPSPPAPPAD